MELAFIQCTFNDPRNLFNLIRFCTIRAKIDITHTYYMQFSISDNNIGWYHIWPNMYVGNSSGT